MYDKAWRVAHPARRFWPTANSSETKPRLIDVVSA